MLKCPREFSVRGHTEDGPFDLSDTTNWGNFHSLLKFGVDAGDLVLKDHHVFYQNTLRHCIHTVLHTD